MNAPNPSFYQSMKPLPPGQTQDERRTQLVEMASVLACQCFDDNGIWQLACRSPEARERIWICFALLLGTAKDVTLANAILAETRYGHATDSPADKDFLHPFDIFVSNHCVQMVVLHRDKMKPDVLKKMERWARVALSDYPGDRQSDLQFHGYNDNMPSKAAMGMILGGEYFGDEQALQHGLWSLRQLKDMLTRRGLVSEFNSPTYSPLTVANLSEIARFAKNAEARELASQCAQRAWADVLGHFHPPTGMLSGPYSRAYTVDSVGHLSSVNFMLWLTFGDIVRPNPLRALRTEPPRLVLHHEGDRYFVTAQKCWLAAYHFDPPAYLVDWMNSRTYPFSFIATAERGEGGELAWEASEVLTTNYQAEDFALATSEGDWTVQSEDIFLQYRRADPARDVDDVRTGYAKYLINDEVPGTVLPNHNGLFSGEKDYVNDLARYHTVQHENVAMVLAGPQRKLAGQPITRMRLAFILPEHLSAIEHIEYSDGHIWLHDGPFQLAIRPMGATNLGGPGAVTIEKVNRYRVIWLPNYDGPSRTFTANEIDSLVNGFILIAGGNRQESFASFKDRVRSGRLLDYFSSNSRTARYQLGDLELAACYGMTSGRTRFISINGKVPERPIWKASGLPAERLPLLGAKQSRNSLGVPFEKLAIAGSPNAPWQIFSRGDK